MRQLSQSGEKDSVMVQDHLYIERGFGNIISGPLSNRLINCMPSQGQAPTGYRSRFGVLILYPGVTALPSAMNFLWKGLNLL